MHTACTCIVCACHRILFAKLHMNISSEFCRQRSAGARAATAAAAANGRQREWQRLTLTRWVTPHVCKLLNWCWCNFSHSHRFDMVWPKLPPRCTNIQLAYQQHECEEQTHSIRHTHIHNIHSGELLAFNRKWTSVGDAASQEGAPHHQLDKALTILVRRGVYFHFAWVIVMFVSSWNCFWGVCERSCQRKKKYWKKWSCICVQLPVRLCAYDLKQEIHVERLAARSLHIHDTHAIWPQCSSGSLGIFGCIGTSTRDCMRSAQPCALTHTHAALMISAQAQYLSSLAASALQLWSSDNAFLSLLLAANLVLPQHADAWCPDALN